jgi:hypothetical protein
MADTSLPAWKVNREELAWAAGFFDGEGHTRVGFVSRRGGTVQAQIKITISQAGSTELLERFRRAVGVGNIYGPYEYRHKRPTQKPFHIFDSGCFATVQHCVCCLWPWLGSIKRAQAANALLAWHAHPRKWFKTDGQTRRVCGRGHLVAGSNAYIAKAGNAVCRECRRQWDRDNPKRKKDPKIHER